MQVNPKSNRFVSVHPQQVSRESIYGVNLERFQ